MRPSPFKPALAATSRLVRGFCYLVAIIDWYSRYVVHWELLLTLEIPFCLDNIMRALEVGIPDIHNSDQGSHFTSPQYTDTLKEKNVSISMDGRGRCMDNIFTERLRRTVKYEDIYLKGYATIERDALRPCRVFPLLQRRTSASVVGLSDPGKPVLRRLAGPNITKSKRAAAIGTLSTTTV